MKPKIAPIAVLAIACLSIVMIAPIHASYVVSVYGWTDRASYLPGDAGTIHVTVRNQGTQAFTVKNITVNYPWKAFVIDHWDGNFTAAGINQALATGQSYNTQYTFTIPTDGRAAQFFGTVSISVGTDIGSGGSYTPGTASISIAAATYQPVSVTTSAFAIATVALLAVAVGMLFLVYTTQRKLTKK
ncbi:MAG TPA: hypothetical protein VE955_01055 [Candidatus Dormibacteraeota bacterium]|jgi:uncharacterized membrane protein|nr:hypothetical protein [Candidatus Dormibacteraeota bacterium]